MRKLLIIIIILLLSVGCHKTKPVENSAWQIEKVNFNHLVFTQGIKVEFFHDYILLYKELKPLRCPVIITETRIVIDAGFTKWLFEIASASDTTMVLRELYTNMPLEITLLKINNLKKKKL